MQGLSIFTCYLCDLFLSFIFIFITINHIISLKHTYKLAFCTDLECLLLFLDDNKNGESEWFSNSKSSASGCCLAFA